MERSVDDVKNTLLILSFTRSSIIEHTPVDRWNHYFFNSFLVSRIIGGTEIRGTCSMFIYHVSYAELKSVALAACLCKCMRGMTGLRSVLVTETS